MFYQFNHLGSPDYLKAEFGENFSFPLHLHQCYEFVTVLSGEMQLTVDDKEYLLKAGEGILIFPNQIHSFKSQKSEHFLMIFSPRLVQAFNMSVATKIPKNNKFTPDKRFVALAKGLLPTSDISEKRAFCIFFVPISINLLSMSRAVSKTKNLFLKCFYTWKIILPRI